MGQFDRSTPTLQLLVAVSVLVGGGVLLAGRLSSPRPQAPAPVAISSPDALTVRSRLWQDPILPAQRDLARRLQQQDPELRAIFAPLEPDAAVSSPDMLIADQDTSGSNGAAIEPATPAAARVAASRTGEPAEDLRTQPASTAAPDPPAGSIQHLAQALAKAVAEERQNAPTITNDADGDSSNGEKKALPRLLVMGLTCSNGGDGEAIEFRRKQRYALVQALGQYGLDPEATETQGYVAYDPGSPASVHAIAVPYEWFSVESSRVSRARDVFAAPPSSTCATPLMRVLVLWLDGDVFSELATLRVLLEELVPTRAMRDWVDDGHLAFSLIGPDGTKTLLEMARSIGIGGEAVPDGSSPTASTRDALVRRRIDRLSRGELPGPLQGSGRSPVRRIDVNAMELRLHERQLIPDHWTRRDSPPGEAWAPARRLAGEPPAPAHARPEPVYVPGPEPHATGDGIPSSIAWDPLTRLRIHSPLATAPLDDLIDDFVPRFSTGLRGAETKDGKDAGKRGSNGETTPCPTSLPFVSVVCSDAQIAGVLLEELRRRGVRLPPFTPGLSSSIVHGRPGHDHIVIIHERDTYYGRSFPSTLIAELDADIDAAGHASPPRLVHEFAYLRGMDGQSFAEDRAAPVREAEGRGESGRAGRRTRRLPEGPGQYDYLQRLVGRIRNLPFAAGFPPGDRIRAIGIVGIDVYDKLLLLQALKHDFPDAVFFTTDLDARLVTDADARTTMNLVVASSGGLEWHADIQRDVPPFRGVYQATTYLAVMLAVGDLLSEDDRIPDVDSTIVAGADRASSPATPRLFEIGRHGAVPLDGGVEPGTRTALHPRREPAFSWWRASFWVLLSLSILGIASIARPGLGLGPARRDGQDRESFARWRAACAVGLLLLAIPLLLLTRAAVLEADRGVGEPFAILGGISVWPTEIVRAGVAILCVVGVMHALVAVRAHDVHLARRHRLSSPPPLLAELRHTVAGVRSRWRQFLEAGRSRWGGTSSRRAATGRSSAASSRTTVTPIEAQWAWYLDKRRISKVAARTLGMFGLVVAATLALRGLFEIPVPPARGHAAMHLTVWHGFLTMVLVSLLVCLVVTIVRLDARFARRLADRRTDWTDVLPRLPSSVRNIPPRIASELLDVRFIVARTRTANVLILYPFFAITGLLLARNRLFDAWDWTPFMVLWHGGLALMTLAAAVTLRRAAEESRQASLERLHELRLEIIGRHHGASIEGRLTCLEEVVAEITSQEGGAYRSWTRRPAVQTLVPFFGAALVGAAELLTIMGL